MGTFHIQVKPYQKNSTSFSDIIEKKHLDELAFSISNSKNYDVNIIDERNEGKYIIYEDNGKLNYICILYQDPSKSTGRNSTTQSLSTAYRYYYDDPNKNKEIYFYALSQKQLDSYPKSVRNSLRMAVTLGLNQLQPINGTMLAPYNSTIDLIKDKNETRTGNKTNNPTFIEYSDEEVKVYGKVFGANAKDTELTLFAISKLTNKEIKLYQVMDNNSKNLSRKFKEEAAKLNIFIEDDVYSFDELSKEDLTEETLNLRNKNFIYNLYGRFGAKKCLLCDCEIDTLIQGAHIFPIEAIKNSNLPDEKKLELAMDGKNGMWLCQNHHRLFDTHIIRLDKKGFKLEDKMNNKDSNFIKKITMPPENPKFVSHLADTGFEYNTNYSNSFGFNFTITDNAIVDYIENRNGFYSEKNK